MSRNPWRRCVFFAFTMCACTSQPALDPQDMRPEPQDASPDLQGLDVEPPQDLPDMSSDVVEDAGEDMGEDATRCGDGVVQPGEACDDGNDSFADGCSPTCQQTHPCEALPIACEPAQVETNEHHLVRVPSCGFALSPRLAGEQRAQREVLVALRAKLGAVHIEDVLSDLNRSGTPGITAQSADRLKNHDWSGFRWNAGDMDVSYWYPQGMTGSSDAHADGKILGRDVVLVSWYNKTSARPTKGARLSLADITNPQDVRYRHLLLVEPTGDAEDPNFGPVESSSGSALHVGGIVWYGDLLYVADTTGGLRVFDLASIFRANDFDADVIGLDGPRVHAHGYAYAVPEVTRYTPHLGSCPLRFSFVSLDRSSTPHTLVTGEYRETDHNGRIVVWPLDPQTGLPDVRLGEVRAVDAFVSGQTKMQGAARLDGDIYISSSGQYQGFGRLYRTRPGLETSSISAWVKGAEDLYIDIHTRRAWTPAEHPGTRDVVGIPMRAP